MTAPPTELAGTTRYAGSRINRVEDARLLTGRGTYADDITLPGMLHACFVRSPHARAAIRGIDVREALAVPGVKHVFVAADLNPGVHAQWHTILGPKMPETPRPPLADDEVRFVGDQVALVLATDRYVAEDAADLVQVDYDPLPAVVDLEAAEANAELVHAAHGSNLIGSVPGRPVASLAEVYDAAAHVVRARISQQAYAAVPMEGRGLVVDASSPSGDITIHAATQSPHDLRSFAARLLGVDEHRVRVIMKDTGGGFGQKVVVQRDEMAVLLAGQKIRVPVKWVEDRRENLLSAGKSRHELADVAMAFDDEGTILTADIDFLADCGAYPSPWPVGTNAVVGMLFPGPYRVPAASFVTKAVYTNTAGRTPYRGPWQFETLAREVLLDISARQMGIDAIELRRRNLLRNDELPYTNANGMTFDHITPLETFEHAIELLGYEAFRAQQAAALAEGRCLGVGTSTYVEPSTPGFGYYATEAATIRIEPSGKVNVYLAGGSAGNSLETTVVQLTADALGVDIADVHTIQGDTAVTGFGAGTAGSRSGSMTAGAIAATAAILRERIAAIAAHRLEAAPEDIELGGSRAFVRGTPAKGVALAEIAGLAYFEPAKLPEGVPPGLEATARHATTGSIHVNATHVCTCEVDPATGVVRLLRYIVSEDCGPMINPDVVEGQIAGGVVQGIGGALLEHLVHDEEGNPLATTFVDYLMPTAADVPTIEFGHVETPSQGPGGYKGVGEGGAIGAPPAVVNAVNDALAPLGVTLTTLPLSPSSILGAIIGA